MTAPVNGSNSNVKWIQSFANIMGTSGNSGRTNGTDRGIFAGGTRAAGGVGDTTSFSSADIANIQEKIKELQDKKEKNLAEIERLKTEIEQLTREADAKKTQASQKESQAKQKSSEAAQEKDNAESQANSAKEKYKQDSKAAAQEAIDKYNQDKKAGKDVSESELQQNIGDAVDSVSTDGLDSAKSSADKAQDLKIDAVDLKSDAVSLKAEESSLRTKIDADKSKIDSLTQENLQIDEQIAMLQIALEKAQSSSSNGSSSNSNGSGDPIGFDFDGETYEFIVDDGAFDETTDFLGYDNQWEAMEKLDADGNGTVDIKELKEGNIKVVNSKGEVGDLEKLFGSDFSVDLKSYDKNGQYSNIDTGDHDGDGTANQELLGTFNVNIGGQSVKGRNTLDDNNFLSEKYGIKNSSSSNSGAGNIFNNSNTSTPIDNDFENKAFSPKNKMFNSSSSSSNGVIEKAKSEMNSYKNSLLSKPFEETGKQDESKKSEDENDNKKKHNIFSFKF